MNSIASYGPLITFAGTMLAWAGSAVITLYFGPRKSEERAREREERAWQTHVQDTIRDFRESYAVLRSISEDGYDASFPLQHHLTKLAIPPSLKTTNLVQIGNLSEEHRLRAINLENLLENINRDVATLLRLVENERREAFDLAARELGNKLYNLANTLLRENPDVAAPAQSSERKQIVYEDGTTRKGITFQLCDEDTGDERLRPAPR